MQTWNRRRISQYQKVEVCCTSATISYIRLVPWRTTRKHPCQRFGVSSAMSTSLAVLVSLRASRDQARSEVKTERRLHEWRQCARHSTLFTGFAVAASWFDLRGIWGRHSCSGWRQRLGQQGKWSASLCQETVAAEAVDWSGTTVYA